MKRQNEPEIGKEDACGVVFVSQYTHMESNIKQEAYLYI